jgi:hypothetical protein
MWLRGANLHGVAIAGGGPGLRSWLDPATDRMIAAPPATTIPEDTQRGPGGPQGEPPRSGHNHDRGDDERRGLALHLWTGSSPKASRSGPIRSISRTGRAARRSDQLRIGKVTKQAAVLQVTLQRGSEGLPPVDVRPIPGGAGIPWNLAVFKPPAGAAATKLALLDSRGRRIASATS